MVDPAKSREVGGYAAGAPVIKLSWATDPGLLRRENEDSLLARHGTGGLDALVVVADGMGGHAAGRLASTIAVEVFVRHLESDGEREAGARRLLGALEAANGAVLTAAKEDSSLAGMGCTLVAVAIVAGHLALINVGDSPAYLIREGRLRVLSQDHSWPAEQARLGVISDQEARDHPMKHRLTRAVGVWDRVQAYTTDMDVRAGDFIVLCTDGVETGALSLAELRDLLVSTDLDLVPDEVVARCRARGAPDNVSIAVARID
ncbi:MAG: PP2C family protein-serine/threonine phosphatase [Candidatus Dormibacteraceae bacterium]